MKGVSRIKSKSALRGKKTRRINRRLTVKRRKLRRKVKRTNVKRTNVKRTNVKRTNVKRTNVKRTKRHLYKTRRNRRYKGGDVVLYKNLLGEKQAEQELKHNPVDNPGYVFSAEVLKKHNDNIISCLDHLKVIAEGGDFTVGKKGGGPSKSHGFAFVRHKQSNAQDQFNAYKKYQRSEMIGGSHRGGGIFNTSSPKARQGANPLPRYVSTLKKRLMRKPIESESGAVEPSIWWNKDTGDTTNIEILEAFEEGVSTPGSHVEACKQWCWNDSVALPDITFKDDDAFLLTHGFNKPAILQNEEGMAGMTGEQVKQFLAIYGLPENYVGTDFVLCSSPLLRTLESTLQFIKCLQQSYPTIKNFHIIIGPFREIIDLKGIHWELGLGNKPSIEGYRRYKLELKILQKALDIAILTYTYDPSFGQGGGDLTKALTSTRRASLPDTTSGLQSAAAAAHDVWGDSLFLPIRRGSLPGTTDLQSAAAHGVWGDRAVPPSFRNYQYMGDSDSEWLALVGNSDAYKKSTHKKEGDGALFRSLNDMLEKINNSTTRLKGIMMEMNKQCPLLVLTHSYAMMRDCAGTDSGAVKPLNGGAYHFSLYTADDDADKTRPTLLVNPFPTPSSESKNRNKSNYKLGYNIESDQYKFSGDLTGVNTTMPEDDLIGLSKELMMQGDGISTFYARYHSPLLPAYVSNDIRDQFAAQFVGPQKIKAWRENNDGPSYRIPKKAPKYKDITGNVSRGISGLGKMMGKRGKPLIRPKFAKMTEQEIIDGEMSDTRSAEVKSAQEASAVAATAAAEELAVKVGWPEYLKQVVDSPNESSYINYLIRHSPDRVQPSTGDTQFSGRALAAMVGIVGKFNDLYITPRDGDEIGKSFVDFLQPNLLDEDKGFSHILDTINGDTLLMKAFTQLGWKIPPTK